MMPDPFREALDRAVRFAAQGQPIDEWTADAVRETSALYDEAVRHREALVTDLTKTAVALDAARAEADTLREALRTAQGYLRGDMPRVSLGEALQACARALLAPAPPAKETGT